MPDFDHAARTSTKAAKRARRETVRIDLQASLANPDNDHSRDNIMGFFTYWHYKITKWVPDNMGGYDGKRQTNRWTEHYARRMHLYERRQSEKKAARVAAKRAKGEQQRVEQGLPGLGAGGAERKRKVSDMFSKKSYANAPVLQQKVEVLSYPPEEEKLPLG